MNIKKQIILDDKDYERLVHDVNLSDDEIKSRIANALTTDKERLIIFQMKDSRNIKSSCQIPIKRNFVSRDIIM